MRAALDYKYLTKDCDGCPCRDDDICLWGVRDKKLVQNKYHGPRHCEYIGQPPNRPEITRRESRVAVKPLPERVAQLKLL